MNNKLPLRRLILVFCFSVGVEFFVLAKLATLQLFYHSEFRSKIKHQSEAKVKIQPLRGRIYDRYYRILATSIGLKRVYPFGTLASNLLGFVGKDGTGLEGIEYEFDAILSGKPNFVIFGKTPRGKLYPYPGYCSFLGQPVSEGACGNDIVLTIDADIQSIVEETLKSKFPKMRAKSGSVIIIEPNTGEILAMATIPCCSPGNWINRPVQVQFEPGSTFKVVPISIIIKNGLVSLSDIVEDGSSKITVQGKTINDIHPHGPLTFAEAVWKSSNVAFVKLANLIGRTRFYNGARFFGFGVPTGVILPGEAKGSLAPPADWSELKFANLAFGQGLSCNLLQLTFAYQAIANDGILLKPMIVKEMLSSSGKVIYKSEPIKVREILTPSEARRVKNLLYGVIENGSGILAKIPGLEIAGKTGTGQKCVNGKYTEVTSSFIGFLPAQHPKLLIACVIDEPGTLKLGGDVCAPLFKEIAQNIILLQPYRASD
ncbi:MAG: penicillin-binding protein 2 [bacterium]|nr:penicillin-binding protein 2 [bacterium]